MVILGYILIFISAYLLMKNAFENAKPPPRDYDSIRSIIKAIEQSDYEDKYTDYYLQSYKRMLEDETGSENGD